MAANKFGQFLAEVQFLHVHVETFEPLNSLKMAGHDSN